MACLPAAAQVLKGGMRLNKLYKSFWEQKRDVKKAKEA